jgi:hypothetical protein
MRYATNRKVMGSNPNDVIEIFNLPNPSSPGVDSASNINEY